MKVLPGIQWRMLCIKYKWIILKICKILKVRRTEHNKWFTDASQCPKMLTEDGISSTGCSLGCTLGTIWPLTSTDVPNDIFLSLKLSKEA